MTLWMPNKKKPLYAPMLGSLGGGSARGFGRGLGGGGGLTYPTNVNFIANTTLRGAFGPTSTSDLNITNSSSEEVVLVMDTVYGGYFHFGLGAGTYQITVDGASGTGNPHSSNYYGAPARMRGRYTFPAPTDLVVLLGQPAYRFAGIAEYDTPGSGGTFLATNASDGNISSATPLLVAGGASIASTSSSYGGDADASLATYGNNGSGGVGSSSGGSNGYGGSVGCGFGAAGFYGNGNEDSNGNPVESSRSCVGYSTSYTHYQDIGNLLTGAQRNAGAFVNGGQGAVGYATGVGFTNNTQGGFGGGAASGNNGNGGGGGYSGGGSTYSVGNHGGGGGSYYDSGFTNVNNYLLAANNERFGEIEIITIP